MHVHYHHHTSPDTSLTSLNTHLQPKIFHPFTTTSLSFNQFDSLKKKYINQVISKCGYNNKYPKAFKTWDDILRTRIKIPFNWGNHKKIKGIQSLFYKPDSQKGVQLVIAWYQHVSGLPQPILEISHNAITYVNSIWMNNFIELL